MNIMSGQKNYGPNLSTYIAIFCSNIALSGLYPIIPIHIKNMGSDHVAIWSGFIVGVPFLLSALTGPIWSRLAQTFGFKMILSLQSLLVSISLVLQSIATTPLELFITRAGGNLFAGIISSLFAYIAFASPKEYIGKSLTYGSIASSMGFIIGPGLLGSVAAKFGFKQAFLISALTMFIAFIINFVSLPSAKNIAKIKYSFKEFFSKLFGDIHKPRVQKAYFYMLILFALLAIPTTLEGLFFN